MFNHLLTIRVIALLFFAVIAPLLQASDNPPLIVGDFSSAVAQELPENWGPLNFEKIPQHTDYAIEIDEGKSVVKATSTASSSGLTRKISINPRDYPIIKWRWKVTNTYQKGDARKKTGDDYSARIYITFKYNSADVGFFEKVKFSAIKLIYGDYPPIAALNYIWGNKVTKNRPIANPYTDRVWMVPVESGNANVGKWVSEERNIYEDYKAIFGGEPPLISGVAIMTDSDNTKESATAYYGDIIFLSASKKH